MTTHKYQTYIFHSQPWKVDSANYLLGTPIDSATATRLLTALETTPVPHNFCLGTLNVHTSYHNCIQAGYTPDNYKTNLDLYADFSNNIGCRCAPNMNNYAPYFKVANCAKNIASGKCRDEYMRKTVGTILFPQHYATDKQK